MRNQRIPRRTKRTRDRLGLGTLAVAATLVIGACDTSTGPGGDLSGQVLGANGGDQHSGAVYPEMCDGTLGAIEVEKVDVPAGATCILDGTRVYGNVLVRSGAILETSGAHIEGNIQAEDAMEIRTTNGTFVGGNVQVQRRALVRIEDTTIEGDLQLEEHGASLYASGNVIGGNLQFTKADEAMIVDTRIDGDLQLQDNYGALSMVGNHVWGNLQVFKNLGGVSLVENRVEQNLQCQDNTPAPTGSGNVAGEKEDQCAWLGADGGDEHTGAVYPEMCDGTLGAIEVEKVDVPAGATCILDGTRVYGNVLVRSGAILETSGAHIEGNIQAEDAMEIRTTNGTFVGGNVQVQRRALVRIEDTTIEGDLQLEEHGASLYASGNVIGGNLQFTKADEAMIVDTRIDGDLQLQDNYGALSMVGNHVWGNLQVFKNLGGVSLVENRVEQNLQCQDNTPAPTGSGNVAGEKEDQCAWL